MELDDISIINKYFKNDKYIIYQRVRKENRDNKNKILLLPSLFDYMQLNNN